MKQFAKWHQRDLLKLQACGTEKQRKFKRWPNGLASRRKFWTCVQIAFRLTIHLRRLPSTCDDLRELALTLVELKFGRTQVDASLPFGHPAQVDTSWSQEICCYNNALTNDMREIYGFLRLASRLANPFGHLSQVHMQVLVLQTCVDLRRRASLFWPGRQIGQRFIKTAGLQRVKKIRAIHS